MDPKELREQAIRDTKAGLILDAARQVFSQKGYWETRLEDIAAAAGFSKASLYNYYADKEELFLSLAIREYHQVVTAVAAVLDLSAPFDQNLRNALATLFTHFGKHFALMLSTTNYQTMMAMHTIVSKHEALAKEFHEEMNRILAVFENMVQVARKRGEIGSSLDDSTLARFIGAVIRGVLFDWKLASRVGDINTATDQIVDFACHGLAIKM